VSEQGVSPAAGPLASSGGRSAVVVVVVGGGLAGITAALDCARSGADVTLLEARGRLGGAAYSFARDELTVDNGQHVFLRCCTAYRTLLEQLEATDLVKLQSRLEIPVLAPGGREGWLRRSGLPAPLHLAGSLARYPFLDIRARVSVAMTMQRLRKIDPDDPRNDERSFGEWLRENRQTGPAIAAVWELVARPTLNLTVDDASLAQAAQVFRLGLLQDKAAGDIGWAAAPLSEIHDRAARQALERAGVDVRLRTTVKELASGPAGLRLEASGGYAASVDAIVLAVPPAAAAQLLPPQAGLADDFASGLGRSAIINLHVVYDRRVLEHPFIASVDTPVQWVFDRTASSGLKTGQYLAISLSAADDELAATDTELRARYLPALAELMPPARSATVQRFFVTREHSATFRASPNARSLRPAARTDVAGLVLAGAWTDTGWPATMEGAVRSGHNAASEVIEAIAHTQGASQRGAERMNEMETVGVMRSAQH
jgi:squalene-associated FAD-dependent desaturase